MHFIGYFYHYKLKGYLGSTANLECISDLLMTRKKLNPDLLVFIDPVMGDHGKMYLPVILLLFILG